MSRSYYGAVSQPNKEQSPRKIKKQFNKKVRQQIRKVLDSYNWKTDEAHDLHWILEEIDDPKGELDV